MTTTDEWVTNNPTFDPSQVDGGYTFLLYLSVVVAALVLTHSRATHWQKPRYTATRVQTEVAATALLASSTLVLVAQADGVAGGALGAVLVYDFFYLGVLNVVIQLCDLYMFFLRFQAVCRVTPHTRVRIQVRHHHPSQPSRRCLCHRCSRGARLKYVICRASPLIRPTSGCAASCHGSPPSTSSPGSTTPTRPCTRTPSVSPTGDAPWPRHSPGRLGPT
jgi:hypothetical protein